MDPIQTPITDRHSARPVLAPPDQAPVAVLAETPEQAHATASILAGGSVVELAGGIAALVLSIIGLAGASPVRMAAAATLAAGVGLLAHGAAVAVRWNQVVRGLHGGDEGLVAGGVGIEVLGGIATVVLGAVVLAGVISADVLAVAALVLGASLVLAGAVPTQLAVAATEHDVDVQHRMRRALAVSAVALALVGIGALVLGFLGATGAARALPMALVSMLGAGCALLAAGGASTFKFARALAR